MGELRFAPDAFSGVSHPEDERILKKIERLWEDRSIIVHHPLRYELSGYYKRRLGKYRIVYSYDENTDEMIIHLAGIRDSIYRDATKKLS